MDVQTQKLFEIIFQEAHVIDFDFSQWDRRLRLVVVAGLHEKNFEGRGPLHNVDFRDVKTFSWHANHLKVQLASQDRHCQWVIMEFDREKSGEFEKITLSGFGPASRLEITCKKIAVSEMHPKIVDQINPNWNRPYCPLARPGLRNCLRFKIQITDNMHY